MGVDQRAVAGHVEMSGAGYRACVKDLSDDRHGPTGEPTRAEIEWRREQVAGQRIDQMSRGQITRVAAAIDYRHALARTQ